MKLFKQTVLLCVLLTVGIGSAMAQKPRAKAKPQATQQPAQATQQKDMDPNTLANAGLQLAQLIDTGRVGEAWDGASTIAKRSVERTKFVTDISAQRKPLGAVVARRWTSVNRHSTKGSPQLPDGTYANIEFDTSFAGGKTGHELVSFRLDEDGTWRLSGYVLK